MYVRIENNSIGRLRDEWWKRNACN